MGNRIFASVSLCLLAVAAHAGNAPARVALNIEPQPVRAALKELSDQAGVQVLLRVDNISLDGVMAPKVSGTLTMQEALERLLASSGLKYEFVDERTVRVSLPASSSSGGPSVAPGADQGFRLAQAEAGDSQAGGTRSAVATDGSGAGQASGEEEVLVSGTREVSRIGVWEGRKVQDAPYSLNVTTAEVIQNIQAVSPDQIFKMNPVTQFSWPQSQNDSPYVFMRGFLSQSSARNGIPRDAYNHGTTTEDVEKVEVLTGLSGFMYGAGNVGGMVNYESKRPTEERLNSITAGYTGGSNFYLHGDFGGQFNEAHTFGYRVNGVVQDGDTRVDGQSLKKNLLSAAFDWKVTDTLLLQIEGSRRDYRLDGRQAYWAPLGGAPRPDPDDIDSGKLWAQKWSFQDVESTRVSASARWQASDAFTLRVAALDQKDHREAYAQASHYIIADGLYLPYATANAPQDWLSRGYYALGDLKFHTGALSHRVTAGTIYSSLRDRTYTDANTSLALLPIASIDDGPMYVPEPTFAPYGQGIRFERVNWQKYSWLLGDDITFNEHWSMLVGASYVTIDNESRYAGPATPWTVYDKSDMTPTASLIYKPVPNVTLYANYMQSLEAGGVAADTYLGVPVVNAGEVTSPLVSDQIELGMKATVGEMLMTVALFNIDKALQYYDISDPTRPEFVQSGRQVHKGIEFTASGKLTEHFGLIGGFTLLDASVEDNEQDPALEGKRPVAVSEKMFKVYAEYSVPGLPLLVLNAGVNRTGGFYGDALNTDRIAAYTVFDAGVRYGFELGQRPVTLRLNVNNVTDKRYWANEYFLGDARTVLFSVNTKF